jgi:hypothetical protein
MYDILSSEELRWQEYDFFPKYRLLFTAFLMRLPLADLHNKNVRILNWYKLSEVVLSTF